MASWASTYSSNGAFSLYIVANTISQEENNNRSLVRYSAYMTRTSSNGFRYWNYNTTSGSTNFAGHNVGRSINGYDFNMGVGKKYYLVQNWDKWIGHNSNGTKSITVAASHNSANGSIGSASLSRTYNIPSLYQEIAISSFSFPSTSDVSFQVKVNTNRTANRLELSINGGGYTTYFSGNFTSRTVTVGSESNPLDSGTSHNVKVRVRRASNNNLTESGTKSVSTDVQGKFFGLGDY